MMIVTTEAVFGNKIRYYRKLRALTQKDLAKTVGINPTHLSNVELGKKGVSLEVLQHICKILEICLADVLPERRPDESQLREELIAEVISVMNGLDTERLRTVRTMVGALKG